MDKLVLRLAFLLVVLSLVGFAGLNSSLNPSNVARVSAANVVVNVGGSGPASALSFTIGGSYCPDVLLPGDTCTADVTITNTGTDDMHISQPVITETGDLDTCTGMDPNNPGTGGNNITTTVSGINFTNGTTFNPGESTTFQISVAFSADATNACEGKSETIDVTVTAFGDLDDIGSPPTPPQNPPTNNPPTNPVFPPPNNDNGGTSNGGPITNNVFGNQNPLMAEVQSARDEPGAQLVLPSRLPASGTGGYESDVNHAARLVLYGTMALAAGLTLIALTLWLQRRRDER